VLQQAPSAGVARAELAEETGLTRSRVIRGLEVLLTCEAIGERRGRYRVLDLDPARLRAAVEQEARRRAHDRTRIEMMRAYARVEGCRRQFLLHFFGQFDAPDQCGMCDRCVPRSDQPAPAPRPAGSSPGPFRAGDRVHHAAWGPGVVQHVTDGRVTVHFPEAGYRTLDVEAVVERGLLIPS